MRWPLVSCIVPTTAARSAFLRHSIDYFTAQTYKPLQLVVIGDDGLIGHKRNLACEQATGDIICHWDDDDWYGPHRVQQQVDTLMAHGVEATGYNRVLFADDAHRKVYEYCNGAGNYGVGATLMYWRSLWDALQFRDRNERGNPIAEDNDFVRRIPHGKYIAANGDQIVARIHDANTVEKRSKLEIVDTWVPVEWARLDAIGYQSIL